MKPTSTVRVTINSTGMITLFTSWMFCRITTAPDVRQSIR